MLAAVACVLASFNGDALDEGQELFNPKGNVGSLQLVLTVLLLTPRMVDFWCRKFS